MKLLRVPFTATLKTFCIRGFAATTGNLQSQSRIVQCGEALAKKEPNLVSLNAVIQGLCGDMRMKEAEEVLEEMNRKGLVPDETTSTSLFHLFCHNGKVDKAYKVLIDMIVTGFSPSLATFNAFVHAYCDYKTVDEAVGILRGLADKGLSPDAASYTLVITRFIGSEWMEKRIEMKKEMLDKAIEMKKEMLDKGFLPDAVTYLKLIDRLRLRRRLSEAFDLLQEMSRVGLSPNEHTYIAMMLAYCLEGEFSKAFHLHDEMIHTGFLPDSVTGFSPSIVTYNALIHGYCFLERVEEALGILRGMAEMGLSPNAVSYNTVISGFCRIREPAKAYHLNLEMDEKRIRWLDDYTDESLMEALSDEHTYSSLMNDYFAQGNMEKANDLEYKMIKNDYLSYSVTFGVFLNGVNKKARTREAKEDLLWNISSWCSLMPTYVAHDILIENCINNEFKSVVGLVKGFSMRGLVNEAARAHDTMLEGNYKPDGAVYNLLIFDHSRCRNVKKAYDMYMEMVHYGFAPHMFSVFALLRALCYHRRYNDMSWVIQNTLGSCNLNDSAVLKVLNKIDVRKYEIANLWLVLAEIAMDGLLLDGGGKCTYASAST